MAELIAKTPCEGLLPLTVGGVSLTEESFGVMTVVAPFRGREAALAQAMRAAHGVAFPAPNRSAVRAGARVIWFGRGQALLIGPEPDPSLAEHAALTDQSDAWAVVRIEGERVEDVLARLVPVDLRVRRFKRGHTARTLIGHMAGSVTRVGPRAFQLMVFRSMAATLVHEVRTAMEAIAARGVLEG